MLFDTFPWLMVYKLLLCSPNILSGLIRRLTDRKCGLIAIKQRKRYLHADLSNVGQWNRLTNKLPLTTFVAKNSGEVKKKPMIILKEFIFFRISFNKRR